MYNNQREREQEVETFLLSSRRITDYFRPTHIFPHLGITGVSRDFYRETIKVNFEGIRNYYHTPTVLLLNNLPRQVNEYDINVPENFILPLANSWDYVSGSPTCEIFISGDVAGPYFLLGYDEWLNTDNLIQRTTAPGDSGVFDFAMMIYNLRYMLQGKLSKRRNFFFFI